MTNPITNNSFTLLRYIITVILVAVIYTYTASPSFEELSARNVYWFHVCDAAVFAIFSLVEVLFLWNILQYGIPSSQRKFYRGFYIAIVGVIMTGVVVGAETLSAYWYFQEIYPSFVGTLPLRVFILSLLFIIASMYYLDRIEVKSVEEDICDAEILSAPAVKSENTISRITIKSGNGIKVIPVEEILYIKAEGDYICIHTMYGYWLKEQTMKSIEEQLPGESHTTTSFIRIHRSFIVNTSALTRIERYGQQHIVEMKNGDKIRISQTGYKILKARLQL